MIEPTNGAPDAPTMPTPADSPTPAEASTAAPTSPAVPPGSAPVAEPVVGAAVLSSMPQAIPDTEEQEAHRERFIQALSGAATGSIPDQKFMDFLEARADGFPIQDVAEKLDMSVEAAVEGEKRFVEWLFADAQAAVRALMADDARLWRFAWHYQRQN